MSTLREDSKKDYAGNGHTEHVIAGALQRIADASELTAQHNIEMLRDLEKFRKSYYTANQKIEELKRSNNALRGVITKLKKGKNK